MGDRLGASTPGGALCSAEPAPAELRDILGAGRGHAYFQDRGRRAVGLEVTVTDIDHLDVDLS